MNIRTLVPAVLITGGVILSQTVLSSSPSVSDREFGLSKTSVFEVPNPPEVTPNRSEPGEEPVLERDFSEAPPVIPHGIADFLPITRSENGCLDCHLAEEKIEGEPTPIPESHFRDLRNAPETIRESIAGARYVCTTCHVPLTRSEVLVENGF